MSEGFHYHHVNYHKILKQNYENVKFYPYPKEGELKKEELRMYTQLDTLESQMMMSGKRFKKKHPFWIIRCYYIANYLESTCTYLS